MINPMKTDIHPPQPHKIPVAGATKGTSVAVRQGASIKGQTLASQLINRADRLTGSF